MAATWIATHSYVIWLPLGAIAFGVMWGVFKYFLIHKLVRDEVKSNLRYLTAIAYISKTIAHLNHHHWPWFWKRTNRFVKKCKFWYGYNKLLYSKRLVLRQRAFKTNEFIGKVTNVWDGVIKTIKTSEVLDSSCFNRDALTIFINNCQQALDYLDYGFLAQRLVLISCLSFKSPVLIKPMLDLLKFYQSNIDAADDLKLKPILASIKETLLTDLSHPELELISSPAVKNWLIEHAEVRIELDLITNVNLSHSLSLKQLLIPQTKKWIKKNSQYQFLKANLLAINHVNKVGIQNNASNMK